MGYADQRPGQVGDALKGAHLQQEACQKEHDKYCYHGADGIAQRLQEKVVYHLNSNYFFIACF